MPTDPKEPAPTSSSRLVYKHLIKMEALQALRDETLVTFLRPYEMWCAQIGVDLDRPFDEVALRRLHHASWSEEIDRPDALNVALVDLGDIAGVWGAEATVHAAVNEWREGRLEPAANPIELAFREYLQRSAELFGTIAQRVHGRAAQRLVEFTAHRDLPLEAHRDAASMRRFESELGRWFEARGRTSFCKVDVDESSNEVQFRIVRGMIPRFQETIVDGRKLDRIEFVPARPDLLVFDKRTSILAVNAQLATEHDCYRRVFGRVCFDDEDHFRVQEIYSGEPLFRDLEQALSPDGFPAIAGVVLREVRIASKRGRVRGSLCGDDIGDHLAAFLSGELFSAADIRFVKLAIYLRARTRPTLVELTPPNRCKLDRRIGEDLVRDYLLARGFLRLPILEPREPVEEPIVNDMAAE